MKNKLNLPKLGSNEQIKKALLYVLEKNPTISFSAAELCGCLVPTIPKVEAILRDLQEEGTLVKSKSTTFMRTYKYASPAMDVEALKDMARKYLSKKIKAVIITGMLKKFGLQSNGQSHKNLIKALDQMIETGEVELNLSKSGKPMYLLSKSNTPHLTPKS